MHVDDLLFCGDYEYFHGTFLRKCQEKFQVSHSELCDMGTSISFLKKKVIQLDDGILITPGFQLKK